MLGRAASKKKKGKKENAAENAVLGKIVCGGLCDIYNGLGPFFSILRAVSGWAFGHLEGGGGAHLAP